MSLFGLDLFILNSLGGEYDVDGLTNPIPENALTFNGDILTFNSDILTYTV